MNAFKKIFTLKKSESNNSVIEINDDKREQIRITFYQSGWSASIKATGKPIVLKACLDNVYNGFEDQCRKQELEQKKLKQPYKEEKERQNTELKKLETAKGIFEEKETKFQDKIDEAKNDIIKVKQQPEIYGLEVDRSPKMRLYIGLALLLPITIYLFVFYISASYSSFFKVFEDDALIAAIFDANALTNAFAASMLEGVLVITIPFVFLGLGYLVHMMQKEKNIISILKLISILIMTFLFDGLLAYQIEKKIYEFNKTLESSPYNLEIALGESEFWMIIFAGFVVYLIWGMVFDFVMKEYDNLDIINVFIKGKKAEIKNFELQKTKIQEKIHDIMHRITNVNGKIEELQSKIDGFIFPIKEYLLYHSQYKEGWFQAIGTEIALAKNQKDELLKNCENICQVHLQELGLIKSNNQNIVFTSN